MFSRRWAAGVLLATVAAMISTGSADAAEPALTISPLRLRIFIVRRGIDEVANFGSLPDTTTTDRFIVIFFGTGTPRLTVTDADATGDTISIAGTLQTVFPTAFTASATSPDQIEQNLLVTGIGVAQFTVQYTALVNPSPGTYFFNIRYP